MAAMWVTAAVKPVRLEVQPLINKHLADFQSKTMQELLKVDKIPALGKTPVRRKAVVEPWIAMEDLEGNGLTLAEFAKRGPDGLGMLLDLCQNFLGCSHGQSDVMKPGILKTLDEHTAYMVKVLNKAKELNDEAFSKIKEDDRREFFRNAANFVHTTLDRE